MQTLLLISLFCLGCLGCLGSCLLKLLKKKLQDFEIVGILACLYARDRVFQTKLCQTMMLQSMMFKTTTSKTANQSRKQLLDLTQES